MNDLAAVAAAVSRNVHRLRGLRGWTLDELARRSGVSKGMVVQIEQGTTNPSIATLCRIANGFGVAMPTLVEVDDAPPVRVVRAAEAARLWGTKKGSSAHLLAGWDGPGLNEAWTWTLAPGDRYDGEPHPPGAREMLHVVQGRLTVEVDRAVHHAGAGDSVVFRADRAHRYANEGRAVARFLMFVAEPSLAPAKQGPSSRSGSTSRRTARRRP